MKNIMATITTMLFISSAFAASPPVYKDPIAVVHGNLLYNHDCENIESCITQRLIDDFATRNSIAPTENELKLYSALLANSMRKDTERHKVEADKLEKELAFGKMTDRQKKDIEAHLKTLRYLVETDKLLAEDIKRMGEKKFSEISRGPAVLFVGRWKIMNALYEKYKGRIAVTKFGPVPVDAIRSLIVEEEKKDGFKIYDKDIEKEFQKSLETDTVKSFYEQKQGEAELAKPPWIDRE